MTTEYALLYWDRSCSGWAWRHIDAQGREGSGPVDGDLTEDAALVDVLFEAGSDLPTDFADVALWRPLEHDGPGWEAVVDGA